MKKKQHKKNYSHPTLKQTNEMKFNITMLSLACYLNNSKQQILSEKSSSLSFFFCDGSNPVWNRNEKNLFRVVNEQKQWNKHER